MSVQALAKTLVKPSGSWIHLRRVTVPNCSLFGKPDNWSGGVKIGLRLPGDKTKVNI